MTPIIAMATTAPEEMPPELLLLADAPEELLDEELLLADALEDALDNQPTSHLTCNSSASGHHPQLQLTLPQSKTSSSTDVLAAKLANPAKAKTTKEKKTSTAKKPALHPHYLEMIKEAITSLEEQQPAAELRSSFLARCLDVERKNKVMKLKVCA